MSIIKFIFWSLVSIVLLGNAIKFEYSAFDLFVMVFNVFMTYHYLKLRKSLYQSLASFVLFIYIFLSINLYAFGNFTGLMDENYTTEQRAALALFGNNALMCFFIGSIIFSSKLKTTLKSDIVDRSLKPPISRTNVYTIICFAFVLSIVSYILGIGRMGAEGVQLPFKLNGIIQMIRTDVIPIVIMIVVARNYHDKKLKIYLILFFFLALLETFVMLSKSRLIFLFLPLLLYYILRERRINKRMIKAMLPVVLVFFLLYPIIGAMRYIKSDSRLSLNSIKESKELSEDLERKKDNDGIQIQFYNRSFLAGQHYMNAYPTLKGESLFNFSRLPIILVMGGSAAYETHVIEQFPETAMHSSGTTGITDALLLGGHGLAYITILLLTLFASMIDRPRLSRKLILKVFLLLLFIELIRAKSFSTFLDVLIVPFIASKIVEYFLIKKSYKKNTYTEIIPITS